MHRQGAQQEIAHVVLDGKRCRVLAGGLHDGVQINQQLGNIQLPGVRQPPAQHREHAVHSGKRCGQFFAFGVHVLARSRLDGRTVRGAPIAGYAQPSYLFGSAFAEGIPMTRRVWKNVRATSLVHALRLCKEHAMDRRNLSVERIADLMGASHDSLYKWLGTGRMPANLVPAYEHACGCHFVTDWYAATAGRLVVPMPTGRAAAQAELLAVNSSCAAALELLTAFYADPAQGDAATTLQALRTHLEQVAYHHHNVARCAEPELGFDA